MMIALLMYMYVIFGLLPEAFSFRISLHRIGFSRAHGVGMCAADQKLDKLLGLVTSEFKVIKEQLNGQSENWEKLGSMYELTIRTHVKDHKGSAYAQRKDIRSLHDLSQFCIGFENEKQFTKNTGYEPALLLDGLAQEAMKGIPDLRAWHSSCSEILGQKHISLVNPKVSSQISKNVRENMNRKSRNLLKEFSKYDHLRDTNDKLQYLKYSPLGLYSFSRLASTDPDQDGYMTDLEIDLRGNIFYAHKKLRIEIGEIISGKGKDEGLIQLLKRLAVLNRVFQCVIPPDKVKHIHVNLRGMLVTHTQSWESPLEEDIKQLIKDNNFLLPHKSVSIVTKCYL